MRVTTQMLNESARRAGITRNGNTLLDYINKSGSGTNSIADALSSKNSKAAAAKEKSNYENLDKAADGLKAVAETLQKSGDETVPGERVEEFVKKYNETMEMLDKASGKLNEYYSMMLEEAAYANKEALKAAGITFAKDGKMQIDKDVFGAAEETTIKGLFGGDSDFLKKISYISTRVGDNAEANAKSISNQYNAKGGAYTGSFNKYDFWG